MLFENYVSGQTERVGKYELDPSNMNGWIRLLPGLVILFPFLISHLEPTEFLRIMGMKPLRERPHQHRHRQKRPRDLDEREPIGMVARDGHGVVYFGNSDVSPERVVVGRSGVGYR